MSKRDKSFRVDIELGSLGPDPATEVKSILAKAGIVAKSILEENDGVDTQLYCSKGRPVGRVVVQ